MYVGGVTTWTLGECEFTNVVYGCTYTAACNFDPMANQDNGTCLFPPFDCALLEGGGCLYPDAFNFNPEALFDDGSCEFPSWGPCPGDVDGDGSISVGDILSILGVFGTVCN